MVNPFSRRIPDGDPAKVEIAIRRIRTIMSMYERCVTHGRSIARSDRGRPYKGIIHIECNDIPGSDQGTSIYTNDHSGDIPVNI